MVFILLQTHRLTVFARSCLLIGGEVAVNLLLWVVTLVLLLPRPETRPVLSLAVLAYTFGLRHALDMDHIVAIDNATRNLVSMGQLPVTCGFFFSLGHCTIVLVFTIAIIATTNAIEKLGSLENIGGVIGVSISASFLLLLAILNTIYLVHTLRKRSKDRKSVGDSSGEQDDNAMVDVKNADLEGLNSIAKPLGGGIPATTCLSRLGKPVFKLIDKPWKMYLVGVLFGLGFDTASEIALLGISALAMQNLNERSVIPRGEIILLPLLFTAGMSLLDSCDSVFMLHAYALPKLKYNGEAWWKDLKLVEPIPAAQQDQLEEEVKLQAWDTNSLFSLTISLTVLSIIMAFLISFVQFMSLAIAKCSKCAHDLENDPGLSGRWWRFWDGFAENSGYIGPAVIGAFIIILVVWSIHRRFVKKTSIPGDNEAAKIDKTKGDT